MNLSAIAALFFLAFLPGDTGKAFEIMPMSALFSMALAGQFLSISQVSTVGPRVLITALRARFGSEISLMVCALN